MTTAVSLHGVRKDFGSLTALSDVTLEMKITNFLLYLALQVAERLRFCA